MSTASSNPAESGDHLRYKQTIDPDNYNTSHVQIVNIIPDGAKVLDVGCACGDLGAYLHYNKNCSLWGMEYDPRSADVARSTGAYEQVEVVDLNSFTDHVRYAQHGFDCIVFGDVLEHLYSPHQVLKDFIPLLGPNGSLVVSLPNIAHGSIIIQMMANMFEYMDYGVLDRTHLRFYTYKSIAKMFAELGLAIGKSARVIWDLPGLHHFRPTDLVNADVLASIATNPHSYVLQYIAEIKPSKNSVSALEEFNWTQLCTFTQREQILIGDFQRNILPQVQDGPQTDFSPPAPAIYSKNLYPRCKAWLKSVLPRPLWEFLKSCRDMLRRSWRKRQSSGSELQNLGWLSAYRDQIQQLPAKTTPDFVNIASRQAVPHPSCPKTIAFYLPQFHPFPENDAWWGRGFTEWTNVTKAVPMFVGHNQPQLPVDLGFYDLRLPDVMHRQVELAKLYGIYGFCFHYYWFSGKRLMLQPLLNYLNDPKCDLPFCFCWANEPWSRRWDGSEDDLLIGQELKEGDDRRFIEDMLPFLKDSRYIAIDGKPALIIYRPQYWDIERVKILTSSFRAVATEHGLSGMYLICALTREFCDDPRDWGFDAGIEFPPHRCGAVPQVDGLCFVNDKFNGTVHDMRALVDAQDYMSPTQWPTFKTAFPAWDNTARRLNNALIFHNDEPTVYKRWLKNLLNYTSRYNQDREQFVFINAWNEWAEGAHLEPDRKYGYAYLQATAEALEEFLPESGEGQGDKT